MLFEKLPLAQSLVIDSAMNTQDFTQTNSLRRPRCQLSHIKRNGHTYYGKQNYQYKLCDRRFVERHETVSREKRLLIKSLLLERLSLSRRLSSIESVFKLAHRLYRRALSGNTRRFKIRRSGRRRNRAVLSGSR